MASNSDIGTPVELFVYDLSQGMAQMMAPMLISNYFILSFLRLYKIDRSCYIIVFIVDREIDGIWHTSVHAYGMEYFFGASGIQMCTPVRNFMSFF